MTERKKGRIISVSSILAHVFKKGQAESSNGLGYIVYSVCMILSVCMEAYFEVHCLILLDCILFSIFLVAKYCFILNNKEEEGEEIKGTYPSKMVKFAIFGYLVQFDPWVGAHLWKKN